MQYCYVIKSKIGKKIINNEEFDEVKKVPLFSPKEIKKTYDTMMSKFKNAKIFKRTSKGWIELSLKDVDKEIPKGHKKAYKVAI